ncbi:hypothetical protein [Vibrio parahaemolyticus]|uniref:hypothetical protein n=1 Tax=Vibrio parahaemolyticus TaxID=670 RepID=UPI001120ACF9|nr:hypothetical protein [Vibrio parahaemolyticus]TOQ05115.1 hypothetical protein CGH04_22085 [Vibrio parahaemolyticus]HCH5267752.1 hypothetical protein [Vibrio parahaemolyticus]
MSRFKNSKKTGYLGNFNVASIDSDTDKLACKCKFNFGYFDPTNQDFDSWTHPQLVKLLNKIREYSKEPLAYWTKLPIEKRNVLEIYGEFPHHSKFDKPKSVPHQARWGTFRLEGAVRLAGFVIPDEYENLKQNNTDYRFCTNTFYVVFLDLQHEFYPVKKK